VVTHDRRFLDAVATRIVELDRGRLASYPGSFGAYQMRKREQLEAEAAQAEFEAERQSHGVFALRQVSTDIAARFADHAKNPPALPGSDQANQAQAKIDAMSADPQALSGQGGSPPPEQPATAESIPAL
jgi:ATPase subunit of ABC transporter with duplicated ATPase domains